MLSLLLEYLVLCSIVVQGLLQTKLYGKRINDSQIAVIEITGIQMCLKMCEQYSNCRSINYFTTRLTCELNNRNSTDDPSFVVDNPDGLLIYLEEKNAAKSCGVDQRSVHTKAGSLYCSAAGCVAANLGVPNEKVIRSRHIGIGETIVYGCKSGFKAYGETKSVCKPNGTMTVVSFVCYKTLQSGPVFAFLGRGNIGTNDYAVYTKTGLRHELDPSFPDDCYILGNGSLCKSHYRSGILDMWETLNITVVDVVMYNNDGEQIANVSFHAQGSTYLNWFDASRILSSSWVDLKSNRTYECFSILGSAVNVKRGRYFFIFDKSSTCTTDMGWMMSAKHNVSEKCPYDTRTPLEPTYLACPGNSRCVFETESEIGAVMAIFIRSPNL